MERTNRLIGEFDETKIAVEKDDMHTVFYDITEIVNALEADKTGSVLEYVVRIEVELGQLLDEEENFIPQVREWYEEATRGQYCLKLSCYKGDRFIYVENDTRTVRLTFRNGSVMQVSNSEWGDLTMERKNS